METFKKEVSNIITQPTIKQKATNSPTELFSNLFDTLTNKYGLLEDEDRLKEIKEVIIAEIKTSTLKEMQKEYYIEIIKTINNYYQLFLFFEQEIKGL